MFAVLEKPNFFAKESEFWLPSCQVDIIMLLVISSWIVLGIT